MRLWHEKLISVLPRAQLLGQHRECCALRGLGWGRKHSTVDYVFKYSPMCLGYYHIKVLSEMKKRGYNIEGKWWYPFYRGKRCEEWRYSQLIVDTWMFPRIDNGLPIYPEHNDRYLENCIENLKGKGIEISLKGGGRVSVRCE